MKDEGREIELAVSVFVFLSVLWWEATQFMAKHGNIFFAAWVSAGLLRGIFWMVRKGEKEAA